MLFNIQSKEVLIGQNHSNHSQHNHHGRTRTRQPLELTTRASPLHHQLPPFRVPARLIPFVSKRFRSAWSQAIVVPHSHNGSIEETSHTLSSFINNFNEHDPSKSTRKMELHLNKSTSVSTILGPHNTMHVNFFSKGSKKEEDFCWQIEIKDRRVESKGFLVKTLWLESVDSFSFLHGVGLFFA
ncbi:unnamed protein product [Brassica oleracea var. botrytis]